MRHLILVAALLSTGCAYHAPDAPSPVVVPPSTAAASIRLVSGSRPDRSTDVVATVLTSAGAYVAGARVELSTSAGSLSSTSGVTDGNGTVRSVLTNGTTATVRASAAGVSNEITVPGVAPLPDATTPPIFPPAPGPSPTPSAAINVSAVAVTGQSIVFSVAAPSLGQTWHWTFGDGGTADSSAFTTTHTYTVAGVYMATVSAAGVNPGSATITVSNAPLPPVPVALVGLHPSIGCTAGLAGATTSCNLAVTYNGAALPSTAITRVDWDWGDGQSQIVAGPPAAVGTHTFTSPGTYAIVPNITATTVDGLKQVLGSAQSVVVK